jgi:hypothetical protein
MNFTRVGLIPSELVMALDITIMCMADSALIQTLPFMPMASSNGMCFPRLTRTGQSSASSLSTGKNEKLNWNSNKKE